jgi:hypothetical protein
MDIEITWHLLGQVAGWIAAALTLLAFTMRTMVPLRVAALAANVFFVIYGASGPYWQPLFLHGLLLPFNACRLVEIRRVTRQLRTGRSAPITAEMIAPFARWRDVAAGETLFRKGDRADNLYMIVTGQVRIVELDITLGRGEILGEIAFFAPDRTRMGTARAEAKTRLLEMDEAGLMALYATSPTFGFRIIELITARLIEKTDGRRDADGAAGARPPGNGPTDAPGRNQG